MNVRHGLFGVAGLGVGVASLVIARSDPAGSLGGKSIAADLALLGAGWGLTVCGLVAWVRRTERRFGVLLGGAGCAWFLVEFNNAGVGSPGVFTIGLVSYAVCPALVAHAALAYPDRPLKGRLEPIVLTLAYGATLGVLGLMATLVFDPSAQGCSQCPANLLAVTNTPRTLEALNRVGIDLGLVWAPGLALIAVRRLAGSSAAARLATAPVLLPAVLYLALVTADYAHSFDRGLLSNDGVDERLWLGQAGALVALALGVVVAWVRGRRARTAVAKLVIELGDTPAPGGLRDALADALADPGLEIAYPLDADRQVDARGQPVWLATGHGRVVTQLLRAGSPLALLAHRAELLDDHRLIEEVTSAARIALDQERLQAELCAQLDLLRVSRARTVHAADAERRRLERDLHDGAQQRLVVLSIALRLLRGELRGGTALRGVDAAQAELSHAVNDLRTLAQGIYPAVLTDEGLGAALAALGEDGPTPLTVEASEERFAAPVETAVYFVVAEVVKRSAAAPVRVRASHTNGRLLLEIDSAASLDDDLVELRLGSEDRIGALDGELTVERTPSGHTMIRAEVPCAS